MVSIQFDRVAMAYPGGNEVLCDFSLSIEPGELCVLVGPSGGGKTTVLRLLAGLEKPTAGRILMAGSEVQDDPPAGRNVAMVFQRPAIFSHLNVADNLAFGLRLRQGVWGRLRSIARMENSSQDNLVRHEVEETAALLGLNGLLDRFPGSLSGGQQQRLALGRALARKPAALLLDEPFSQLDASLRSELRHELHLLAQNLQATILHVTHDHEEAMTLADRLVVLHEGSIEQVGATEEIYLHPKNRFVAGFLGWPAMNFVDGHLHKQLDKIIWDSDLGSLPPPDAWAIPVTGEAPGRVTVGIRPEYLVLDPDPSMPAQASMRVRLLERLGYANLATLERGGCQMMARIPGERSLEKGSLVQVGFRLEKAHVFDSRGAAMRFAESSA